MVQTRRPIQLRRWWNAWAGKITSQLRSTWKIVDTYLLNQGAVIVEIRPIAVDRSAGLVQGEGQRTCHQPSSAEGRGESLDGVLLTAMPRRRPLVTGVGYHEVWATRNVDNTRFVVQALSCSGVDGEGAFLAQLSSNLGLANGDTKQRVNA